MWNSWYTWYSSHFKWCLTLILCGEMVKRASNNVKNENQIIVNIFHIIKLSNAEYLF